MSLPNAFAEHIERELTAAHNAGAQQASAETAAAQQQVQEQQQEQPADAQPAPEGQAESDQGRQAASQAPAEQDKGVPRRRFDQVYGKAKELEQQARTLYDENQSLKIKLAKLEGTATALSRRGAADQGAERTDEEILAELLGEDPPQRTKQDAKQDAASLHPDVAKRLEQVESQLQQARNERVDNYLVNDLVPALVKDTGLPKENILRMLAKGMEPQEIAEMFKAPAQAAPAQTSTRPAATPPPTVPKANSNATAPARAPTRSEWLQWVDTQLK